MVNRVDIQIESQSHSLPTREQFQSWVDTILKNSEEDSEIVIRIVDEPEMIQFNKQYRQKKGTTNILSFPFDAPDEIESILLGDLLICAPVIEQEAQLQNKKREHHWAHMIIHGILHLLGYDHIDDDEAKEMEALEIKMLSAIDIANPYQEKE
jgi:probable rRNA maturation factor